MRRTGSLEGPEFEIRVTKYLNQFFSLRCCGDVLNATAPINKGAKEITEAMAMRKRIKSLALAKPMHYSVLDLCAGNGLVGALVAFTLPVRHVLCVDKRVPTRRWHEIERFDYVQADLTDWFPPRYIEGEDRGVTKHRWIVTACHACSILSSTVLELYRLRGRHLVLMPCCAGPKPMDGTVEQYISSRVGRPEEWAIRLARECGGSIRADRHVLSPRNLIVTASKEG